MCVLPTQPLLFTCGRVCRSGGHFSMEPKENDGRNPVGELQEMTQKRLWPPPVYEFTNEIGPAHAREFICNVRLFNICEQGAGFFLVFIVLLLDMYLRDVEQ